MASSPANLKAALDELKAAVANDDPVGFRRVLLQLLRISKLGAADDRVVDFFFSDPDVLEELERFLEELRVKIEDEAAQHPTNWDAAKALSLAVFGVFAWFDEQIVSGWIQHGYDADQLGLFVLFAVCVLGSARAFQLSLRTLVQARRWETVLKPIDDLEEWLEANEPAPLRFRIAESATLPPGGGSGATLAVPLELVPGAGTTIEEPATDIEEPAKTPGKSEGGRR